MGIIKPNNLVPFIAGGDSTSPGEFPYMVQIRNHANTPICGGSILTSYLILTAAHCFFNTKRQRNNGTFHVTAGKYFRSTPEPLTEQHREIAEIIIHQEYDFPDPLNNDIALVVLQKELHFNLYVSSIQLTNPEVEPFFKNDTAIVAGWGYVKGYTLSSVLRKATVEFWKGQDEGLHCDDAGKMCAAAPSSSNNFTDICAGDSGGALKCLHAKNRKKSYVCGIVSAGYSSGASGDGMPVCGQNSSVPGVYTQVSYYRDWIISETELIRQEHGCPSGYFQCLNYLCVTNSSRCDGYDDCGDGSDETYGCCETFAESSATTTEEAPCGPILLQCNGNGNNSLAYLSDCESIEEAPANASSILFLEDVDVTWEVMPYADSALIYIP